MDFNTHVSPLFYWHWTAQVYAWVARRKGFDTHIQRISNDDGSNANVLGGNYSVSLSNPESDK